MLQHSARHTAVVVSGPAVMPQPAVMLHLMLLSSACQQQQPQQQVVLHQQLSEAQSSYNAGVALLPNDLFDDVAA
jgi:hypothetical protein